MCSIYLNLADHWEIHQNISDCQSGQRDLPWVQHHRHVGPFLLPLGLIFFENQKWNSNQTYFFEHIFETHIQWVMLKHHPDSDEPIVIDIHWRIHSLLRRREDCLGSNSKACAFHWCMLYTGTRILTNKMSTATSLASSWIVLDSSVNCHHGYCISKSYPPSLGNWTDEAVGVQMLGRNDEPRVPLVWAAAGGPLQRRQKGQQEGLLRSNQW